MSVGLASQFERFLRRSDRLKHFRRLPLLETLSGHHARTALPSEVGRELMLAVRAEPSARNRAPVLA